MIEEKDLKGLYYYIINNFKKENINILVALLQDYVKNNNKITFHSYCSTILDIAMREEIKNTLFNTKNEKLTKMRDKEFNEIASIIAYRLIYKNESVWEHINKFISWELDDILESDN